MNKTHLPFRLIVQRWRNPQLDLFQREEWYYQVIATNMDELEPEEVGWFHYEREQVENLIKEIKIGFGMEQMVSDDFGANRNSRPSCSTWLEAHLKSCCLHGETLDFP
jgi:hypothetical protein